MSNPLHSETNRLLALACERGYKHLYCSIYQSPELTQVTQAEVIATMRRLEHPLDTSMPTVESVHYRMFCKHCKRTEHYVVDRDCDDFSDLEVLVHTDLEDRGWVDGQCPVCFGKECGV